MDELYSEHGSESEDVEVTAVVSDFEVVECISGGVIVDLVFISHTDEKRLKHSAAYSQEGGDVLLDHLRKKNEDSRRCRLFSVQLFL
jgi:hypothetical protein